jgi:hypothetical protein
VPRNDSSTPRADHEPPPLAPWRSPAAGAYGSLL